MTIHSNNPPVQHWLRRTRANLAEPRVFAQLLIATVGLSSVLCLAAESAGSPTMAPMAAPPSVPAPEPAMPPAMNSGVESSSM